MKVLSWVSGVGIALFGAWLIVGQRRRSSGRSLLNINQASQEELIAVLGLDAAMAERVVEQRPYPSKIDLLGRMVVPNEVYKAIKNRISYKAS
jgi:DNA uptake protein ComE-like DNA-binding protein